MNSTIEIRYETLLELLRQMPRAEMERLIADLGELVKAKKERGNGTEIKYRQDILEAARELDAGEGIEMTFEEAKKLILG